MVTEADRAPPAVGVNVTLMVQFPPATTLPLQLLVWANSLAFVPVTPMLTMVKDAPPVLDSVTVCTGLVVFSACPVNVSEVGATPATGIVPVPVSVTVNVGVDGSLVVMVTAAARAPAAVGVNVTLMMQLAAAARLPPHGLVWAKSPAFAPVIPIPVIVKGAPPVLDSVTVCGGPDVPTRRAVNISVPGDTPAPGAMPVPLSETFNVGFAGSLLTMASVADRAPITVGVNVTLIVQLPAAARLPPHALVCAKSPGFAPTSMMLVMVKGAVPVLDRITV
jgi:hypothetical protein